MIKHLGLYRFFSTSNKDMDWHALLRASSSALGRWDQAVAVSPAKRQQGCRFLRVNMTNFNPKNGWNQENIKETSFFCMFNRKLVNKLLNRIFHEFPAVHDWVPSASRTNPAPWAMERKRQFTSPATEITPGQWNWGRWGNICTYKIL